MGVIRTSLNNVYDKSLFFFHDYIVEYHNNLEILCYKLRQLIQNHPSAVCNVPLSKIVKRREP